MPESPSQSSSLDWLSVRDPRLRVAERLDGLTASQAKLITDAVLGTLVEALSDGCAVRLPGLGSFRPVYRAARSGTGPDGSPYVSPARVVVRFRAARELTDNLSQVEPGAH